LPVVIAGDYNIVPEPRDIYVTTSYRDNALVQPAPREQFQRLLAQGWTDALRKKHPDDPALFTFWDYLRNRWPRNAGLRLDHLLLSKPLARKLRAAAVDREVRGGPEPSDHAPVWIELDL
jgi:exodeoxyribonuclease-3